MVLRNADKSTVRPLLDIFGKWLNLPAPLDIQWPECFQLQGGFALLTRGSAPGPRWGGALLPDARYRLVPRTCHGAPLTTDSFRHLWSSRLEPPLILTSLRLWEQGLCNGRASVCLSFCPSVSPSVCPVDRQQQQRPTSLLLSSMRAWEISIDSGGRSAAGSGAQQQMRIASRWQPTNQSINQSINVKFVGLRYTTRPGAPTVGLVSGKHDHKVHSWVVFWMYRCQWCRGGRKEECAGGWATVRETSFSKSKYPNYRLNTDSWQMANRSRPSQGRPMRGGASCKPSRWSAIVIQITVRPTSQDWCAQAAAV